VAILSNFTVKPLVDCLTVQAYLNGIPLELYVAPYNQYGQEALDTSRQLHQFAADLILVILTPEAVVPGIISEPWQGSTIRQELVQRGLTQLTGLLGALRERSRATIIVSNFVLHEMSPLGVLDWQEPLGFERAIQELNHGIADWARGQERVYVFDLAGVCSTFGHERAFDQRMHLLADQPFAPAFLPRLAAEVARYLRATTGPTRKCLVLDLDNTLWGGILGDDGPDRLRLGGDAVGEGHREFQKTILALHNRGILLAICSHNNEAAAMEVLRSHPEMILRPEHFAAERINWLDKVDNLQSLAEELNIGLDSLVFLDDDSFQRQNVRERLPEVLVVDLPRDPVLYRNTLLQLGVFDTLRVTEEDRARGRMYQERRAYERLSAEVASLDDFLSGLEMESKVVPAEGAARTRLYQMVHKTNQFNLTTPRYSELEFDGRTRAADYRVFGVHVRDRLGDSGIVGLVVLNLVDKVCEIETLLMSCRVLGRCVETGILGHIVELARAAGVERIRGYYIPTAKNDMVRDLYERHGFTLAGCDGKINIWEAKLPGFEIAVPAWARVQGQEEGDAER
jgi:FkbH-like protein